MLQSTQQISLHLSNFWMQYNLTNLSIWNSLSSLCTNISLGAGESLSIWHHIIITIPAELWGLAYHTHFGEPLGFLLAGGMTEKQRNHKPVLPIYLRLDISNVLIFLLAKNKTPQYLRDVIQTMYTGCLYLLIDGDKISGEVAPNKGLKQGCPLSPLLYSLYTNDIDKFLTVQRGAATALDSVQVPHCDYADDIALTSNTAECLQFQRSS